ncbi:hypothetical protein M0R45_031100 [Rubus argutus]|uniref:Phytosulfokine-beta n=1 Tax=Rubus argutus TaxID=59490 RepID=A0AAW1WF67_RUBAR
MAFSKAVLLVVFAVLLISSVVSAHGDLAETTNTPTTDNDGRGLYPGVAIGETEEEACHVTKKKACHATGVEEREEMEFQIAKIILTPENATEEAMEEMGKGGRAGYGPETRTR